MLRSKVYKEIQQCLLEKMPELQFVDLQKGQFSNAQQNYPIPLPACLIEFKPVQWSNAESGTQLGRTSISFYLYQNLVTDSFDGAEQENETIALLDEMDKIFQTLQGLQGDYFTPLFRATEQIQQYGERFICFRVDFATELSDNVEIEIQTVKKPQPKFKF